MPTLPNVPVTSVTPIYSNLNLSDYQFIDYYSDSNIKSIPEYHQTKSIQPTFINPVVNINILDDTKIVDFTSIIEDISTNSSNKKLTNLPLFFKCNYTISIPSKVERNIRRHIPIGILRKIHSDREVAIEMCLWFISLLSSTYYLYKEDPSQYRGKSLKAEYLRTMFSTSPNTYKEVITALEYPLETGAIIGCDYECLQSIKCYHYWIGNAYIGKGLKPYTLKTETVKTLYYNYHSRLYKNATSNPICINLMEFYSSLTLPSIEDIQKEAIKLVKLKYTTKKGKVLKKRNKHGEGYHKEPSRIAYVEDAIDIFQYLTLNGLMIPFVGGENSGRRVVDSLTLMPSWIRKLIKYKGKPLIEADYSCLHPNIAVSLYDGKTKHISHTMLAEELGMDILHVKVEHLSFFNKKVWQMKESPLYDYYEETEQGMLKNIIDEKCLNERKHKITSMRMFSKEVEIMTDVIKQLNLEGIFVGYIYDALICEPTHSERVKQVMNVTILKHGVYTTAKVEVPIKVKTKKDILEIDVDLICENCDLRDTVLDSIEKGNKVQFIDALIVIDGDKFPQKVFKIINQFDSRKIYMTERLLNEGF